MMKPKYPGHLISKMNDRLNKLGKVESKEHGMKLAHKKHAPHKKHHAKKSQGEKLELHANKKAEHHMAKYAHHALKAAEHAAEAAACAQKVHKAHKHHAKKMPHLKPKGKRGKAQVARLNRTTKTGGFAKIAAKAGKKYGSAKAGARVAGAIMHKMAVARGNS